MKNLNKIEVSKVNGGVVNNSRIEDKIINSGGCVLIRP
jgi:hypothetical protein